MTDAHLKAAAGEISVDKAVAVTANFLKLANVPKPKDIPAVKRLKIGKTRSPYYAIQYGKAAILNVDVKKGVVTLFSNLLRQHDRLYGRKPPGPTKLTQPEPAKTFMVALAKRLGLPPKYELVQIWCNFKGDPADTESKGKPTVRVLFQMKPQGYPLREGWGKIGIVVDPADGMLLDYGIWPDRAYAVESKTVKLTAAQALAKAQPTVKKFNIDRPKEWEKHAQDRIKRVPQLMYVLPNGRMGGVRYDAKAKVVQLRLAWVLPYTDGQEVWIDAGDGRLLGGVWRATNLLQ